MSQWTPERIELLRELWGGGLTAAQIAERLGGISRNAVIGKAHRMGLSGGSKPKARSRPRQTAVEPKSQPETRPESRPETQPESRAAVPPPAAEIRSEPAAPPSPRGDLPWHRRCQWPIGHPGDADFTFCTAEAEPSRPYCAAHCRQAYRQKDQAA